MIKNKLNLHELQARQTEGNPEQVGNLLSELFKTAKKQQLKESVPKSSKYYNIESNEPDRTAFSVSRLINGIKSCEEIMKDLSCITKSQLAIFDALLMLFIHNPYLYPSQSRLKEIAGIKAIKTANTALRRLQELGLICKIYRHKKTCLYGVNLGFFNVTTMHRLKGVLKSAHLLPMLLAKKVQKRTNKTVCVNDEQKGLKNKITYNKRIKNISIYIYKSGSNNLDLDRVSECVSRGERLGRSGCWLVDDHTCINPVHINKLQGDINPDVYKFMGGDDAFNPVRLLGKKLYQSITTFFGELPSYIYSIMSRFNFKALLHAKAFMMDTIKSMNAGKDIGIKDGIRYFMGVAYKYSREKGLYIDSRLMLLSLACLPGEMLNAGQFGSRALYAGKTNKEVYRSSSRLGFIEIMNRKKEQGYRFNTSTDKADCLEKEQGYRFNTSTDKADCLPDVSEFPKKGRLGIPGNTVYSDESILGERPKMSSTERKKRIAQLEHLKMKDNETVQDYVARNWDCPAYRYVRSNAIDRDAFYDMKADFIIRSSIDFYVNGLIDQDISPNMEYTQPKKAKNFDHVGQYVYKAGETSEQYFNRIGDVVNNATFKVYAPLIKALIDSAGSDEDKAVQVNKNISSVIERMDK